jgi:hypothetical protein
MSVQYQTIYQDSTSLPQPAAVSNYNLANPIPAGLVESFMVKITGTASAQLTAGSTSDLIQSLRIIFNGNQYFNFNSGADTSGANGISRLGALVDDIGGFIAENQSATAVDMTISIPCGIMLPSNSRFEVQLGYTASMGAAATFTGTLELWCKYGKSANATICGNATSFPIPAASQTMMTVAIPSFKGALVSGIFLQGPSVNDNVSSVIAQDLGNWGMTPTFMRGASGASQNGYLYSDVGADQDGLIPSDAATGAYFIPLYDLAVSSGSVNLLITTVAGAGTETYTAIPVLSLKTGGSGESVGKQTASVATGSSESILRRAEE